MQRRNLNIKISLREAISSGDIPMTAGQNTNTKNYKTCHRKNDLERGLLTCKVERKKKIGYTTNHTVYKTSEFRYRKGTCKVFPTYWRLQRTGGRENHEC